MIEEDDLKHLQNIAFGGLMKKVTPLGAATKLLNRGYIRKGVGGLVITESGHHALMKWQKND